MSSDVVGFQRARSPARKEMRRAAILDAARDLGLRDGVRHVTLTDIANAVGIHKSAVLNYFETREEIFLHLTADRWREWASTVHAQVNETSECSAAGLASILTNSLGEQPLFCDLLAHAPMNLERNVSAESVRNYKVIALQAVGDLAAHAQRMEPALSDQQAWQVIVASSSLAGALWQFSHPPDTLAELYRTEPALGHTAVDFLPTLDLLVHALVRGLSTDTQRNP